MVTAESRSLDRAQSATGGVVGMKETLPSEGFDLRLWPIIEAETREKSWKTLVAISREKQNRQWGAAKKNEVIRIEECTECRKFSYTHVFVLPDKWCYNISWGSPPLCIYTFKWCFSHCRVWRCPLVHRTENIRSVLSLLKFTRRDGCVVGLVFSPILRYSVCGKWVVVLLINYCVEYRESFQFFQCLCLNETRIIMLRVNLLCLMTNFWAPCS